MKIAKDAMEMTRDSIFVLAKADSDGSYCVLDDDMIHSLVLMNEQPIHTNLSTSFTNLTALVRYLRGLQFVGSIRIELSSYEAEIEFTGEGAVKAKEQDHIAGRMSFGDDALQRIMIRAKEPGGFIHVYKSSNEESAEAVFIDEKIAAGARKMAVGPVEKAAVQLSNGASKKVEEFFVPNEVAETPIPMPNIMLDAQNAENWSELLALISELMQTVDESLAKGNIRFADAFRNACGFVSFDYPFLDPETDVFSYSDGYISLRQRLGSKELINGITAALARIMDRLREDSYFGNIYHLTMHRLRVLANRRKLQFDTFGLAPQIQKITGI